MLSTALDNPHFSYICHLCSIQVKLISYSVSDYQNDSSGKESVATATTSTRTSKWNETNFSWPGARVVSSCRAEDSDKQVLRMAGDWPGSVQTTPLLHTKTDTARHQPPSHLDRSSALGPGAHDRSSSLGPALDRGNLLSPSKSEHQYDVPWSHLLPRKQLTVDTGQQQEAQVTSAPPPGPPLGHAHDTSYRTKVRDSSYCLPSALVDTFPAFKFSFFYFIQLVEIIMSLETPLKKKEVLLLSQYGKASLNRKRLRKLVGNKIKGVHFSENWGIKLNLKITTLFY